jgi:hypothetical protein
MLIPRAICWILVCLLGGCATAVTTRPPELRLAPRTPDSSERFVLPSRIHYFQHDKRWASDPIGGSGKPLQNVGCAICCLSMALARYGIDRTPGQLNRDLKQVGGYNENGWVYWSAIEFVTGGKVYVEWGSDPGISDIEQALALGQPVLVKTAPSGMVQHWVLLVGREGREFLMRDPLDPTKSLKPLSSLGSEILAVRFVKTASQRAAP